MNCNEIHLRDPYVLVEDGVYYMYGTRGKNFGMKTGGFDVYISTDLKTFSDPIPCCDSEKWGLNHEANWAPEVHKYKDDYYMLATFTNAETGLRGTYILRADNPKGPFELHRKGPLTPEAWEWLDGTLYVSKDGKPYLVFCHEHTQIIDGTVCYAPLTEDLSALAEEPTTVFSATSPYWADPFEEGKHYVTDGPFFYRTKNDTLLMIWSTFIKGNYAECVVRFDDGDLSTNITHLPPIIDDDGGHGMIFRGGDTLYLSFHAPNKLDCERPAFTEIEDLGDTICIKR